MLTIDNQIEKIANSILDMEFVDQNFGLHGMGGKLFLFEKNDMGELFSVTNFCEKTFEWKNSTHLMSFCAGRSGINWIYTYMLRQNLLDESDYNFLCEDDELLMNNALSNLKRSNYDFLHGGLGIAWYFLYKPEPNKYLFFFQEVVSNLERILYQEIKILNFAEESDPEERINISVSHGISSILKFCLQCFKNNLIPDRSKKICLDIIDFILSHKNADTSGSYLPTFISTGSPKNSSRLAWCYGDLTIAYFLLQAGTTFNLLAVKNIALEILLYASKRRALEETGVLDAGICHGSSGIAYIFHKLFILTDHIQFKDASDYWIDRTYSYARPYQSQLVQFPQYNTKTEEEMANHSFLEGTCGVGVVLNSIKNNHYDWDYSLMLND